MKDIFFEGDNRKDEFLSSPKIADNASLLQDIGVIDYIESMDRAVNSYKSLFVRGLDICNHTSIDEIIEATVYQISDHFLPSFLAFLWKPLQIREDITIKAYKNYKPVDMNLHIDSITPFEAFFRQNPKPVRFCFLASLLNNEEIVKPFQDINTEIIVPIVGPLGLYGIILIGKKNLDDEYSNDELFFLHQLMSFVSQGIKNHLHYEHSLHDVKTGLYNHGFFLARLTEEVIRTKRNKYCSTVIVIDVDKFKNFNDNYGHLAGDKVLENLAQVIKKGVRSDDIPSRFGGEEFTVLLPHADQDTAWNVAERLRINVAEMKVPWDVPLPHVTISLGIFSFDQNSNADVNTIIRRADDALYTSKQQGRNRCTIWHPGITHQNMEG
ncbi:MAG: GGDEF domain-containing protein [Treponema sp.]|jgi:diguanylate cyclase (GGDEF)-like protein|nr:GGDEF domain-containing protein [Treponema sp.]